MKNYRNIKIKVKLSSIFNFRTVCKYCLTGPTFYFRVGKKTIRKLPNNFILYKHKTINYQWNKNLIHLRSIDINDVSFSINFVNFNPKIHRQRKLSRFNNFDDVLYCECTKTNWIFNQDSTKDRKEIEQRKSQNFFDKEFTY